MGRCEGLTIDDDADITPVSSCANVEDDSVDGAGSDSSAEGSSRDEKLGNEELFEEEGVELVDEVLGEL